MSLVRIFPLLLLAFFLSTSSYAQKEAASQQEIAAEEVAIKQDSVNRQLLADFQRRLHETDSVRRADSIHSEALMQQLATLKTTDNLKKEDILREIEALKQKEEQRNLKRKAEIESMRSKAVGWPVLGALQDTVMVIYTRIGSYMPRERAEAVSERIAKLYEDDFMNPDSLSVYHHDTFSDIMYGDFVVMSIREDDALWDNTSVQKLAEDYRGRIAESIRHARQENSFSRMLLRIGLMILVIVVISFMIFGIRRLFRRISTHINEKKQHWFRSFHYKDYTFINAEQAGMLLVRALNILRWLMIILLLFLVVPIIFSIFPFTRGWSEAIFDLFLTPLKKISSSFWQYLPKLATVIVICLVIRYLLRAIRYIFTEIEQGKLKINGFHADWAHPTFAILRTLIYAFGLIIIFPYLPGSESEVFKGVSVFLGILVSFGSSSAISNIVAGLVITYMRPFKIGDRIKIGDISGDVIEKTLLVTRLKTVTNEEITIPNSSILSNNTVNYSTFSHDPGLILTLPVTIGYDVPWQKVEAALIEAAQRSSRVQQTPKPFVWQKSLGDFSVEYHLCVYTHEANAQAGVYSEVYANMQDVCSAHGIEIMSPHYFAHRDGNHVTLHPEDIPAGYRPEGIKVERTTPES
ncbi:mechanosensitive ion channel family protein [Porphyromonas loveana]|uniref:mechanosensitive ion channel family protein n=3 Tax=Porphyromonas loveana TaxID=1884669 RepID=UPI0035A0725D